MVGLLKYFQRRCDIGKEKLDSPTRSKWALSEEVPSFSIALANMFVHQTLEETQIKSSHEGHISP